MVSSPAVRFVPFLVALALTSAVSCTTNPDSASQDPQSDGVAEPTTAVVSPGDEPGASGDVPQEPDAPGGSGTESGAGHSSSDDAARDEAAVAAAAERTAFLTSVAPGELVAGTDIAAAPDGTVYVMDEGASRVVRYDVDGTLMDMWGAPGTAEGQFAPMPAGSDPDGSQIAVGPSGVVFTYDRGNERVQKFTAGGQFYTSWPAHAADLAVSPIGTLFVVDHDEGLVKHFCPAGRLKGAWGEGGEDESGAAQCGPYTAGTRYRIAVAQDESVIVADPGSGAVDRCSRTGEQIESWQLPNRVERSDEWVGHLALTPDDDLLVTGVGDQRSTRFSLSGETLDLVSASARATSDASFPFPPTSSDPRFDIAPMWSFDVAPDGAVYAIGPNGVTSWEPGGRIGLATWGLRSAGAGQFGNASGVAIAPDDTVIVADSSSNRLQRFSATGQYIEDLGSSGFGPGELLWPKGVAVGIEGETYVADSGNDRVQVFDPTGEHRSTWDGTESGATGFVSPQDVAVLADGNVAVVDDEGVRVLEADGEPIQSWTLPQPDAEQSRLPSGEHRRQVAALASGEVLVADGANGAVWRVMPGDDEVHEWLRTDAKQAPEAIAVTDDGDVLVAQLRHGTLQRYSPAGEHLGSWPTGAESTQLSPFAHLAPSRDGGLYVAYFEGVQHLGADGQPAHSWGSDEADSISETSAAHVAPIQPSSDVWTMQIFDNPWLAGAPVTTTQVADIDLDWGLDAPVEELLPNGWSARFERELLLDPGQYEFEIASSGGSRLWLGNKVLADLWELPAPEWTAPFDATGPVVARLEFADRGGPASVRLAWQRADS